MGFGGHGGRRPALKPIRMRKEEEEKEIVISSEEEEPLSPMARLFHEPGSNVYIIVMIGFKTQINPEVIKANLEHTLLKHPRFSSLKVVDEKKDGEIKWVRTKVDLDNHVIVPNLDMNMDFPDKFVEDYISNLSKTNLSMSMPMWDLHLLNVKISDTESMGVLRVHHSLGDGTSLMSLLLSCTRKASDPTALPSMPNLMKRKPSNVSGAGGLFWPFLFKVWLMLLVYWNTIVDVVMFLATTLFLEDTKTPLKGSLGIGSTPRRFVHRSISLDDVKLVKNAMDSSINEVMVGITQAGLSRYLNRKYGEVLINMAGEGKKDTAGATERNNNLPNNIRLRATSFVNIRPSPGIQAFADMMKKDSKAKWGNHFGYVIFPFTIALRDDPLDYIRDAKATGQRKKASLEAKYTYFMSNFFLKFLGAKLASFPTKCTLLFSNIPGPQEEISYYDHPVAYIAPSCYGPPIALMIHVVSYVDKMRIILSVDEGIVPHPHQLCDDFEESFKLIKDAVLAKGLIDYREKL